MSANFEELISKVKEYGKKKVSVAVAEDAPILEAVEEARKQEGVIAARMTGAGFGGCAVSIVKNECVDNVIRSVGEAYKQKIGYAADFYVVEIGAGPEVL